MSVFVPAEKAVVAEAAKVEAVVVPKVEEVVAKVEAVVAPKVEGRLGQSRRVRATQRSGRARLHQPGRGEHARRRDPAERQRLMKVGAEVEHAVQDILGIVSIKTYRQWLRDEQGGRQPRKVGRPRLTASLRELILRLAREHEALITVGRTADNSIRIDSSSVSSNHAELTLIGKDCWGRP